MLLVSFVLFYIVMVFLLFWVYFYINDNFVSFLIIEVIVVVWGFFVVIVLGVIVDCIGYCKLLYWGVIVIVVFVVIVFLLFLGDKFGEVVYMMVGVIILGLSFG